jgi:2-hydroxychromene-2-carboxylate isomerase
MSQVELFLDFSCPWSYLALVRLRDVVDRNPATMVFKPVSVHQVLETECPALQLSRLSENPAKAAWQRHDLATWARFWGLQIELHDNWPFDALLPASALVLADEQSKGLEFALLAFAAYFGAGADICSPEKLAELAEQAGLDRTQFETKLADPKYTERVEANNHDLVRRGGFGTPSMFIGDELFYGNDRMPLVEWTLGPVNDAQFVIPGQHGNLEG